MEDFVAFARPHFDELKKKGGAGLAAPQVHVLDLEPDAPRTLLELERSVADVSAFAALAAEVVPVLPLADRIDALSLMFETGDGWRHERSWPFTSR